MNCLKKRSWSSTESKQFECIGWMSDQWPLWSKLDGNHEAIAKVLLRNINGLLQNFPYKVWLSSWPTVGRAWCSVTLWMFLGLWYSMMQRAFKSWNRPNFVSMSSQAQTWGSKKFLRGRKDGTINRKKCLFCSFDCLEVNDEVLG